MAPSLGPTNSQPSSETKMASTKYEYVPPLVARLNFVPATLGRHVDPECVGLIWVVDEAVDSVSNTARVDDVETRVFVPIRSHGMQGQQLT